MQRGGGNSGGSNGAYGGAGGSFGPKSINLEEIWSDLEGGIKIIFTNDRNIDIKRYMQLYT